MAGGAAVSVLITMGSVTISAGSVSARVAPSVTAVTAAVVPLSLGLYNNESLESRILK